MPERWRTIVAPAAHRDLKGLSSQDQARIGEAIDSLSLDPAHARLTKLKGVQGEWRLRVGDFRVRLGLDPDTRTVYIYRVLRRREAYR